jgi:hypothetical protein
MQSFYVRRKDLSHVPFQYYVTGDGTARPLDPGFTSTFALMPTKDGFDVVHVQIVSEWAQEMENRWGITEPDLLRVAAKVVEAWLKNEPIPPDHFYGPDMIKVDSAWYPCDPDQSPAMAVDPYNFMVATNLPSPSILEWEPEHPRAPEDDFHEGRTSGTGPAIVFGFTVDVCPALLILGYEQFRKRAAQKGLEMPIRLAELSALPPNIHTLFVPPQLSKRARQAAPGARVIALEELINNPIFDAVVETLEPEATRRTGNKIERS